MKKTFQTPRFGATRGSANSPQITPLVKGQVWKTGETYVLITDTGKLLVHYKLTKKLLQRGLRKHLASIQTVRAFLKSNGAELMVRA